MLPIERESAYELRGSPIQRNWNRLMREDAGVIISNESNADLRGHLQL